MRSENGAGYTTINGGGIRPVVSFNSGEDEGAVLQGFSIVNGSNTMGGGIFCENYSSPTIMDCSIRSNSAYMGGGIFCNYFSNPTIKRCDIKNNTATGYGAGFASYSYCAPQLINCNITDNETAAEGAGIYCFNNATPTITNCTISNNTAATGSGGISCMTESSPVILNSIIWNNTPAEVFVEPASSIVITYSDIKGGWTGAGNINIDPLFEGIGDYHLTFGSPCEDTATGSGAPADDIDGDKRPYGAGYDMGADEIGGCSLPERPQNGSPVNGAVDINIHTGLNWKTSQDAVSYDVYLDTVSPPAVLLCDNTTFTTCQPAVLTEGTTYYWQVVADNLCGSNAGSVWNFTTCTGNTYYLDADSDGYGDANNTIQDCTLPSGYVTDNTDCDDTDAAINPAAAEICDGKDNNCNGQIDEGFQVQTYYEDADSDGYGNPFVGAQACVPPLGYVTDNTDCDDTDAFVNPAQIEVCDGKDNNCDGHIDEGFLVQTYYEDADGDNYGNPAVSLQACVVPSGYVTDNTDCDDTDAARNPGETEICDLKDNDCNGQVDDGMPDTDGDGLDDCIDTDDDNDTILDVNDNCPLTVNPSQSDVDLDQTGDVCDEDTMLTTTGAQVVLDFRSIASNQAAVLTFNQVLSGGYTAVNVSGSGTTPQGFIPKGDYHDIKTSAVYSGMVDVCLSYDDTGMNSSQEQDIALFHWDTGAWADITQSLDTQNNQVCGQTAGFSEFIVGLKGSGCPFYYRDADSDTYGDSFVYTQNCSSAPAGYVSNNTDCDDTDTAINPAAAEICDAKDNNCDGQIDEGFQTQNYYEDADSDGYGNLLVSLQSCVVPSGYVSDNTDCDDTDAAVNPGAAEICDTKDNDCNGQIDEGMPDTDGDGLDDCIDTDDDNDTILDVNDNCPLVANLEQTDVDLDNIGDLCDEDTVLTSTGAQVALDFTSIGTVLEASLTFSQVVSAGYTSVTITSNGTAPSGFTVAGNYYEITTSALYSGMIDVCIYYDDTGLTTTQEQNLALFHWENAAWVDITTLVDDIGNEICGETNSFSEFVVGEYSSSSGGGSDSGSSSSDDDDGGGGNSASCFIATAAYGTPLAKEVRILCRFRDLYLLPNAIGRKMVSAYYKYSPPAADYIRGKNSLRTTVRGMLTPVIWMVKQILPEKENNSKTVKHKNGKTTKPIK